MDSIRPSTPIAVKKTEIDNNKVVEFVASEGQSNSLSCSFQIQEKEKLPGEDLKKLAKEMNRIELITETGHRVEEL